MQIRDVFWSVIAYGITFALILAWAGHSLDKPFIIGMAALLAGSAYVVQVSAHASATHSSKIWVVLGLTAWGVSVASGVIGLAAIFWGA